MADQDQNSLASTFPDPPPFWKDFTPDRLAKIAELRAAYAEKLDGDDEVPARIPNVPHDLMLLQPPAEPTDGRWRIFGDQYMLDDKLPTLEDQGITNLPTNSLPDSKDAKHYDRAFELKRLAKSLLLNFLELTGILSQSPSDAEAKIQDLRTLFINVHHILNEYRPHQARESAIELMQDHLDRTRTETVAIRTQVDKARRVLEGLGSLGIMDTAVAVGKGEAERKADEERSSEMLRIEREAEVWAIADAACA